MKTGVIILVILATGLLCESLAAEQKPTVAIIGTGTLAGTLGPAMGDSGYTVVYGSRDPERGSVRTLVERTGRKVSAVSPR